MNTINFGENAFLSLLRRAVTTGARIPTRNGDRFTVVGETIKFSLVNGTLPLMTTRWIPYKKVVDELDWFLSGSTNIKDLHAKNCHIWDMWALTQSDVDVEVERLHSASDGAPYRVAVQLTREKIDTIGPMYGHTWRKKLGLKPPHSGDDQITRLIRELKAHPYSTQHVLTTYVPAVKMDETQSCAENILNGYGALTPCHGLHTQFICLPPLAEGGKPRLHCIFTNRSQDLPVGTVFNIAMYALLTHLIAHLCGFEAVELTWIGMHCHIYPDQIPFVNEQVERTPFAFPQVVISPELTDIDQVNPVSNYFTLVNYIAHEKMKMPVTG